MLLQALEKQDDARRFIWAAEYNAHEFFRNVKARKPITGNAGDADVATLTNSAHLVGNHFTDVQAAMQQVLLTGYFPCQPALTELAQLPHLHHQHLLKHTIFWRGVLC